MRLRQRPRFARVSLCDPEDEQRNVYLRRGLRHNTQGLLIQNDDLNAMIPNPLKRLVALVLGLVLSWQCLVTVSAGANQNAAGTKSCCCCSGCDSTRCPTPACCANQSQPAPVSARVPLSISQNELQAPTVSASLLPTLQSHTTDLVCTAASPHLRIATIPIFQRDCSYLI